MLFHISMLFPSYLCLPPHVSPPIILLTVILSFSRLSGVWQRGRWPPLSAEEVGTSPSILPVTSAVKNVVILVTCRVVFCHDKPETWATVTFEWVVCATARGLCLKQGLWFSCSWTLTFLDPARRNEWDFVPQLNENSFGPPHDDDAAAWILWGCVAFFKFHLPTLQPRWYQMTTF